MTPGSAVGQASDWATRPSKNASLSMRVLLSMHLKHMFKLMGMKIIPILHLRNYIGDH